MEDISAYHEAGHALMAICLGGMVRQVTLEPNWDDGPQRHADIQIQWPRSRMTDREMREKSVMVSLAGPAAEMLYTGEPYHPGFVAEWVADWQLAWEAAAGSVADERRRLAYLERVTGELYRLLDQPGHWSALAAIADNLLAHETLEGEEVHDIVAQWCL